ncbi:MAG: redoxin domain-containing protein [Chloroflexi bacterium]|nr:redoxin domain-containing protein [Chloroflexota bacterium]
MLKPGSTAPDFTAASHDGSSFSLSEFQGRPIVLYFYYRDFTRG